MEQDYYEILGITEEEKKLPEKEFEDTLKKKYRKLSMKWHPDRWANGTDEEKKKAEKEFKKIAEANATLSDKEKRYEYDHRNDESISPWDFMFGSHRRGPRKGPDSEVRLSIDIDTAVKGDTFNFTMQSTHSCSHCNGSGAEEAQTCPYCNGTGVITQRVSKGNMLQMFQTPCQNCQGRGFTIVKECEHCHGSGIETIDEDIQINIPQYAADSSIIVVAGKGGEDPYGEGPRGDLIIHLHVQKSKDNKYSVYDGRNLMYEDYVPFSQAMLGYEKDITAPDGSRIHLKVPELTYDWSCFQFEGKGLVLYNNGKIVSPQGRITVRIRYKLPKKLTEKDKELLKSISKD